MREIKNITITPKQDCPHCQGNGVLKGQSVPMPFGSGYTFEPGDFCACVLEQLPDEDETYNIFFKFPEPEPDMRFTWTYGADSRATIFINDNSLPNPKERGIAAITCHQYGNEAAERLAKAFCRALDMLALLQGLLPIIEAEADQRETARYDPDDPYPKEMRQAAREIAREIELANGRPAPEPPDDDDDYDYAADDRNFDAARERSWKR